MKNHQVLKYTRGCTRHGKLTYRDVTPLCVAAIQGEVEVVVRLVVRGGADTEHRASRVNRHRGRPPLTG